MKNKTLRFLVLVSALALATPFILTQPGCVTPPSARVVEVQTLKAVGETAEAAVALSAHLYEQNTITADQARQINAFYDKTFQPAYRLARAAVKANLDSFASPDLVSLGAQLSAMLVQFQTSQAQKPVSMPVPAS
jgi:hypothetical protein